MWEPCAYHAHASCHASSELGERFRSGVEPSPSSLVTRRSGRFQPWSNSASVYGEHRPLHRLLCRIERLFVPAGFDQVDAVASGEHREPIAVRAAAFDARIAELTPFEAGSGLHRFARFGIVALAA